MGHIWSPGRSLPMPGVKSNASPIFSVIFKSSEQVSVSASTDLVKKVRPYCTLDNIPP